MSKVRSDNISNRNDDGASTLTYGAEVPVGYGITGAGGINITGVATAASFSGSATGLTGTPDITVRNITGVGATFSGTVNYEDVTNIDSVGIVTAQGGLRVSGIITARTGTALTYHGDVHITKATERVSTGATSHFITDKSVTLLLDCSNGTVFTHSLADGNVGIVSLTNFPAVENAVSTYSVIFTQVASPTGGIGNTMVVSVPSGFPGGIGTNITLKPAGVTGFTTTAKVSTASTITLATTGADEDVVTIAVHYNGGGTGTPGNYKVYATNNTGYRYGLIGNTI
jgi:hypothetical protein